MAGSAEDAKSVGPLTQNCFAFVDPKLKKILRRKILRS